MELNRDKNAPSLYFQIESILKRQIENEEYRCGDILPSETELQKFYRVSRVTIRQAMNDLVRDGYVKCSRGIGTVVVFEKIEENVKRVISFSKEMKQHGIEMTTSHCHISLIKCDKNISAKLNIPEDEEVYQLIRVRCVKNSPMVYSITYLKKMCDLSMDEDMYRESLYDLLEERYDIKITRGQDTFEAAIASETIADFLKITVGAPVFKRSRLTFDQSDHLIEYTYCYYPGDKYKYTVFL
jgi:Transcriptional regulators